MSILRNSPVSLSDILKHPDVSRAMTDFGKHAERLQPYAAGLDRLRRLRVTWRDYKRACRNAREDAPRARAIEREHGPGSAWDAGLAIGKPRYFPDDSSIRRVNEALAAGLPDDLADRCHRWLAQQDA